jgi:lysophospholipase L1-like esterase
MNRRLRLLLMIFAALALLAMVCAAPASEGALPKVVLLGDSIREGYAPFVVEMLRDRAVVVTPKANGRDTGTLLAHLTEWAVNERPDLIHFNCGIHDTKRNKETGKYNVPPENYKRNLRQIVSRLRSETKAVVVFALSTPLIDERSHIYWKTRSYRLESASVVEYNRIALRVMDELGVPVNDLPAVLGDQKEIERLHDPGGIHFTREGSEKLAAAVASMVLKHLPKR